MRKLQLSITVILSRIYSVHAILLLLCSLLMTACVKKSDVPGVASLNIFNGIVGTDTLVANFNDGSPDAIEWYRTANFIFYGKSGNPNPADPRNNNKFNSYSGDQRFAFFDYPDTLSHNRPVVDLRLHLPVGSINSLFLTGTQQSPDTFFIRDQLPYHPSTDSVTSVRVVNLLPGFTASMNLKGNAPGSELVSLPYKTVSAFKDYSVSRSGILYEFEIRDANSGSQITSVLMDTRDDVFLMNNFRFRSYTLIIYGQPGNTGAGAPAAVLMRNF